MKKRHYTKLVHEGQYVAKVNIELIANGGDWAPCLSLDDAQKLDSVRDALRKGDLRTAGKLANIFTLTPVTV